MESINIMTHGVSSNLFWGFFPSAKHFRDDVGTSASCTCLPEINEIGNENGSNYHMDDRKIYYRKDMWVICLSSARSQRTAYHFNLNDNLITYIYNIKDALHTLHWRVLNQWYFRAGKYDLYFVVKQNNVLQRWNVL